MSFGSINRLVDILRKVQRIRKDRRLSTGGVYNVVSYWFHMLFAKIPRRHEIDNPKLSWGSRSLGNLFVYEALCVQR